MAFSPSYLALTYLVRISQRYLESAYLAWPAGWVEVSVRSAPPILTPQVPDVLGECLFRQAKSLARQRKTALSCFEIVGQVSIPAYSAAAMESRPAPEVFMLD